MLQAEPISQLGTPVAPFGLARRRAAVVLLGQAGRAAAHAMTDRIMPVRVVFLLLEPETRAMTIPVTVARLGASRRDEHKNSGGREEDCVSHSPSLVAAAQSPFRCPDWLPPW